MRENATRLAITYLSPQNLGKVLSSHAPPNARLNDRLKTYVPGFSISFE
jgi:hypothetical protein